MFPKLLLVIVVLGSTACALLVNRQQRIETAHRAALMHQELIEQQQRLWTMRAMIAERCRPECVRVAVNGLGGSWSPVVVVEEPTSPSTKLAGWSAPPGPS